MSTFTEQATAAVRAEIERQDVQRAGLNVFDLSARLKLWHSEGSAGKALAWWEEIVAASPDSEPITLVGLFEQRIETEITMKPRMYYTISHLRGVHTIINDLAHA